MAKKKIIPTLIFLVACLFACSKSKQYQELKYVESIADDFPMKALASLDSMNYKVLSESDKAFYDFLTIKARDKAYIIHTNDSLYLKILNYYSKHNDQNLYPQVLYYGGRVYSDLGDYPRALQFFQQALELYSSSAKQSNPQTKILSQIAILLNSIRLYERAVPYLRELIEIETQNKDSINLMYNLQLLGAIYINCARYDSATFYITKARDLAKKISPIDIVQNEIYLSTILSKTNHHDSAMSIIRHIVKNKHIEDRNNALANAAGVYKRAGESDSAYMYAKELLNSKDSRYTKYALSLILAPTLINFVPKDSLQHYVSEYQRVTEDEFNKNAENEALIQNSYYNYKVHDRERSKKEAENSKLRLCLTGAIFIALVLLLLILYFKYRYKCRLLYLYDTIGTLRLIPNQQNSRKINAMDLKIENPLNDYSKNNDLKSEFFLELYTQKKNRNNRIFLSPAIKSSELYSHLQKLIFQNDCIPEQSPMWDELEKLVNDSYPNFIPNLKMIVESGLEQFELRLALLIKCGFKPTAAAILLSKNKGSLTYHRNKLSHKLFGMKLRTTDLDNAIRSI